MSTFVKQGDVRQEQFDWGTIGWRLVPDAGSKHLVIMDVTLEPGGGHDFHRHPGQEEMIIVKQGSVTQYIEQDSTALGPGDSVYLDAGVIHASFNDGSETAHLQVVIGPSLGGETGYGLDPRRLWATVYTDDDEAAALITASRVKIEREVAEGDADVAIVNSAAQRDVDLIEMPYPDMLTALSTGAIDAQHLA